MLSIFKPKKKASLPSLMKDRIQYACGKNIMAGWLNVDGFDSAYWQYAPGATDAQSPNLIVSELSEKIVHCDLTQEHPFPNDSFRFGFAEDFLEHLTQAQSLLFLKEAWRTFTPGGVLRLSFPGLAGILRRHFSGATRADMLQGLNDAYTMWHHEHFYCAESISLVARHLGWSDVHICEMGVSKHPELHNLETRPDQRDLNLVVELTK